MRQANSHPNVETLKAYGSGQVVGTAAKRIDQHLETCAECRRAVEDVTVIGRVDQSKEIATLVEIAEARDTNSSIKPPNAVDQFRVTPTLPPPIAEKKTAPVAQPTAVEPIPAALAGSPEYAVIREISRGGMGVVYLARNRRMDRLEALKVVNETLLKHAGALERFEREMRAAARLSHSNIVTAYSSPPLDGLLAFAMEFVNGTDLHELVRTCGLLPVANACYYVYQAAQGLQHAHDRQMVHRDIKPNNLMLTRDGKKQVIKILDFGLAKATSENQIGGGLTGTGQMLGTPHYIAPEQIDNAAKADIRADIYGLGCTLYYLLTGQPPFQEKTSLLSILHAHGHESARPLHEVRRDVPMELAEIVARMMAKDAAQRYQQPGEVAQALAPFFKKGIKPIPTGTARFAAPSAAQVQSETAGSKADEATPAPKPPVPVAAAPAKNTVITTTCRNAAEPNQIQTMPEQVAEPPPFPTANGSGRGSARQASSKSVHLKVWLGLAAAIMLLAGLGLYASGIFTVKVKTGRGTLVVEVNVPDAEILVDGEKVTVEWSGGKQTATVGIESGTRNVEVKKEGFTAVAKMLTFKDGKETVFTATLERDVPESPQPAPHSSSKGDDVSQSKVANKVAPRVPSEQHRKTLSSKNAGQSLKNSLGMELVLIPAGEFRMGSPQSELGYDGKHSDDENQVDVTLTKSFYLGKTEVTQGQWQAVMGTTPWKGETFVKEGDTYPATYVRWDEAQAFCKKLSETENTKYRLPTEAEWEYACRGGSTTRFSFGEDDSQLGEHAWYDKNAWGVGEKYAHEVGRKQANPFGLYDMHGNVWEWCEDVYVDKLRGGTDPLISTGGSNRDFRGGNWFLQAVGCRSADRGGVSPDKRDGSLGFRVARESSPRGADPPSDIEPPSAARPSAANDSDDEQALKNSIGMELALIPAGKFRMGSPGSEKDRSSDEDQVNVTLTRSFYLGKTEVTQGQWQAVMGTTPWKGMKYVKEGDNYAATYVSWDDAQAFCKKLSENENAKYRLPTEAEWEYACRGGTTTRYSFGDDDAALSNFAWWGGGIPYGNAKDEKYAHEVGKKQANPFGLYDIHGNVWEWCEDMHANKLPGGTDPLVSTGGSDRVFRGGGWDNVASYCRSAYRFRWFAPGSRYFDLGFRVARVPGNK